MSSDKDDDADDDDDDDDEMIKILMYSIEYAETTDKNEKNITIKKLIDCFDKMIIKSKSFEDQTESLEKEKIQISILSTILMINTTNKKENQVTVKNLNANKKHVHGQERTTPYDWVIQPDY